MKRIAAAWVMLAILAVFASCSVNDATRGEVDVSQVPGELAEDNEEDILYVYPETSPPESDTWEQAFSVHENLPEFILQLRGEETQDVFTALSIKNASTGAVVYQDDFRYDDGLWGIRKDIFSVETVDMDFDGYRDIQIFAGYNGTWRKYTIFILWDSATSAFVGDVYSLGALGNPSFDAESKLVHSMERASAVDHWFFTHEYIDGKLVTTKEESFNRVRENDLEDSIVERLKELEPLYDGDETGFILHRTKQLDDKVKELTITEEKYTLNNRNGEELAEYTLDSEIGMILASSDRYREESVSALL
jgi:hypothetical protein